MILGVYFQAYDVFKYKSCTSSLNKFSVSQYHYCCLRLSTALHSVSLRIHCLLYFVSGSPWILVFSLFALQFHDLSSNFPLRLCQPLLFSISVSVFLWVYNFIFICWYQGSESGLEIVHPRVAFRPT